MSGLVRFSRTLSVLTVGLLLVLSRVPAMDWVIGWPRGRRSGIRTAGCDRGRGEEVRVVPLPGGFLSALPLSLGCRYGTHVGELGTMGHSVFIFWWFAGLHHGPRVGELGAVWHLIVVRVVGTARWLPDGPHQARVGKLGAVRHVVILFLQLGSAVVVGGGHGVRLSLLLVPGVLVQVFPPV